MEPKKKNKRAGRGRDFNMENVPQEKKEKGKRRRNRSLRRMQRAALMGGNEGQEPEDSN